MLSPQREQSSTLTGTVIAGPSLGGETVRAFVPASLPPKPGLAIDTELREEMDQALLALGRLDSVSSLLPDTSLFLYMYVRKEAVLSSQIEGTQSSLSDLLLFTSTQPLLIVFSLTTILKGIPIKSASLNFTPADSPRSSKSISTFLSYDSSMVFAS